MKVLFICNGNVARSQEAEAFFNELKQSNNDAAISAGINVILGKPIEPLVVSAMTELGYDMSRAYRKFLTADMVATADKVVTFLPPSTLPEYAQSHHDIEFWDIADPRHQPIEFYREIRDMVLAKVSQLIKRAT